MWKFQKQKYTIIIRTFVLHPGKEHIIMDISADNIKNLIIEQLEKTRDIDLLDLVYKLLLSEG